MSDATRMRPLLAMDAVTLRYPGARSAALRQVDLAIPSGAVGVLLGGEGAGRSSALHVAAGLAPTMSGGDLAGEVRLRGGGTERQLPGCALSAWCEDVAIVMEDPASQRSGARRTVREEIAFGLECRGVSPPEMERRVDEAMAVMGLTPLSERDPDTLSGGQTTRLALASAWVIGPRVLLLDETDAALDGPGRARLRWLMSAMAKRAGGVLWAPARLEALEERWQTDDDLKDAAEVGATAHPAWVLAAGRMVAAGSLESVLPTLHVDQHGVEPPLSVRAHAASEGAAWMDAAAAAGRTDGAAMSTAVDTRDLTVEGPLGLDIRQVTAVYPGGIVALRDVSLDVEPGTIVALVGANGGGKTTLLRAMLGLVPVASGDIRVGGESLAERPPALRARSIGLAFQRPDDQLFAARILDDVAFGPRNLGFSKDRRAAAVESALRVCGLIGAGEAHPLDLGRGGRRRAALAGVLAMQTPIVALDEPDHGLDARGKRWLIALLHGLRDAGRTVLLVCHDLDLVGAVADRVALLSAGELRGIGPTEDVLRDETGLHAAGLAPPPAVAWARRHGIEPAPVHAAALLDAIHAAKT